MKIGLVCAVANEDASLSFEKWKVQINDGDTLLVLGNGNGSVEGYPVRPIFSNALKIDWDGNAYLAGNVLVGCSSDSTGGTILPHDVQVNGASVVNNGVANVPVATGSTYGVVKVYNGDTLYGVNISNTGVLQTAPALTAVIKAGTAANKPVCVAPARSCVLRTCQSSRRLHAEQFR